MSDYRTPFSRCPVCEHLFRDPTWEAVLGEVPCPECGSTCAVRTWWPYQPDVHRLLNLVHSQKFLQLADERVIAIVFLASAMETLLEVNLWDLLRRLGTPDKVAELLLDAYQGRERRISLYNRLAPRTIREVLESAGLNKFLPAWKSLAEARNGTAHGQWAAGYQLDVETVEYLREHCYEAFAAMNEETRQLNKIDA
jgi:hypothetical protein